MNKALRLPFVAALLLSTFFHLHSQSCTGNLLSNPGFESGLTGWTTVGTVTVTTDVHSGSKAVAGGGTGYTSAGQALAVVPGTSYTASAWIKGNCVLELRYMTANWARIENAGLLKAVSNSTYQYFTNTATVPAGAAYVYLLVYKDQGNGFKMDDACLTMGGGGPTCAITPNVSNIVCDNNNTPSNTTDDRFGFTLNATNPVPGTGYQVFIPQLNQTHSGTYGTPILIQYLPISAGPLTLNLTDNLSANCMATTTVTPPPPCSVPGLPDLLGYVQEIIPGTNNCFTSPGSSFGFISMQINNSGDVAATAFKVKFYFSTDNVLSANDVLWSTVNLPSLNVLSNGGPAFIGPGQPVPASLATGQYYVIVSIDTDNQVAESNEANNTIPPFTVQIGAPDVILDSYAGIPATVVAGSSFNMQVTVKYLANGFTLPTSTSFPVNVYINDISPNIALGSVNYTLADFNQSNTVTKTVQVTVPPSVPTGSHTIRMYANTSFCEDVYLSNYKDQSVTVTSGGGSGIDLELSMVQNTANPVIYSNYTTTLTLVNKGPQAATGVKVKWMKPAGVVYTGGNEFVASQGSFNPNGDQVWTVGSVPANGSATLRVSYFLLQNGAPITYAQVSAANETDVDSQPNNGTPPTPVQDDEANSGGSAPPVLTPDLTISNLVFANGPGTPGQVLAYYFDLANIGNGNAPQDFIVRAWISTSPTFNTTGIQDGIVPTGNFIAGFSVTEVPGASMLPSTLAAGQYYLHLWVDADQAITELNENNNTVSAPFLVQAAAGPGVCDDLIGGGAIACLSHAANGNLEVNYVNNGNYRKATLDGTGQVFGDQAMLAPPVYPTFRIANGNLEKLVGTAVQYSQPIPASLIGQYDYFLNFSELGSGYVIFAYKTGIIYAIRTDANLAVLQVRDLFGIGSPTIEYTSQLSNNQIAFTVRTFTGGGTVIWLYVINGNLDVLSSTLTQEAALYGGASLGQNGCGQYTLNSAYMRPAFRGSAIGNYYRDGHFENGSFVVDYMFSVSEYTSMGVGARDYKWTTRLADGSTIVGTYQVKLINLVQLATDVVKVEKMQGSTVVWTKYVKLSNASSVRRIALSGNELVFLSEKNNAVFVEAMNCVEPTNPQVDIVVIVPPIFALPTSLQAGASASVYPYLTNLGTAPANGFELRAVLSTDNVYSPSTDILIGSASGVSLTPGSSIAQSVNYTVPTNIASGTYQFMLVADAGNVVAESNESNNLFMTPVTVTGVAHRLLAATPSPSPQPPAKSPSLGSALRTCSLKSSAPTGRWPTSASTTAPTRWWSVDCRMVLTTCKSS
ncbi:MAG: carbohydrate binding domain-containing protein [Saprospiraceae bacterium]|nr:carbohydrate binding domain-containing protein [Saprospiraceae bacterium]